MENYRFERTEFKEKELKAIFYVKLYCILGKKEHVEKKLKY